MRLPRQIPMPASAWARVQVSWMAMVGPLYPDQGSTYRRLLSDGGLLEARRRAL